MNPPITVRYAETDDDVIAIHRFLCIVAAPTLPGPIDPRGSATEVWRVVDPLYPDNPERERSNYGFALMAVRDNTLVGTLGLIKPAFWWNSAVPFFVNRWFFALPRMGAGKLLLKEATSVAEAAGIELHIISEQRGRLLILNRSEHRDVLRGSDHAAILQQPGRDALVGVDVDARPGNRRSRRDRKRAGRTDDQRRH